MVLSDSVLTMFCFNFELEPEKEEEEKRSVSLVQDKPRRTEPVKEAKEHFPPDDPSSLLVDAVPETVRLGTLPPLHFLNETVLEQTIAEKDDHEQIHNETVLEQKVADRDDLEQIRGLQQKSDLVSGVYEGGLKVWECTYDLLELFDRDSETFGDKLVLDLGCGAGLLGMLALRRGARQVHFQDYNSTVIEQLTMPTATLNCDDEDDSDTEEHGTAPNKSHGADNDDDDDDESKVEEPPRKKPALDPPPLAALSKCRFFSGDWRSFLSLLLKEAPPLKYDLILTSETIYNTEHYSSLHETLQKLLAPHGRVYLATKSHYFGVGGGLHLFETFVKKMGVFSVDRLWDGHEGLQRHIISLKFIT